MKSTIISMLIILILMVALPMFFLGDNKIADTFGLHLGRPGASASGGVKLSSRIENVTTDTPVQIYRWRDEHGILQFSNTEPAGVPAEKLDLKPNLSSMDAVKPQPEEKQATASTATSSSAEIGNPYSPGGMKQMIEQANELKKVISQQQADQAKTIEQFLPKKH
jgi:hypothetical protein